MSLSINDLLTLPTTDSVNEEFLSILVTLGIPARQWRQGGVARTILKTVAQRYVSFATIMNAAIRSGFLETASGDWLTLLASSVYGVDRRVATFATGNVTFVNGGGGVYPAAGSWQPDEVRVTWPSGKKSYVNAAAFSIAGGATVLVPMRAVEAGSASSVPALGISELNTAMVGVTVSNPIALIGSDAETDNELRIRCRAKLGTFSTNGPRGAYEYAALSALRVDGTPVNINRVAVSPSSSTGVVNVYCASPTGAPTAPDLAIVAANIEAIARPDSVTVNVYAATQVALSTPMTIWARRTAGVAASDIATSAQAALAALVSTYPIGGIAKPPSTQGYLYSDNIAGTAKGVHPSIFDVDGVVADLALSPGQVATLATTITVTVVG